MYGGPRGRLIVQKRVYLKKNKSFIVWKLNMSFFLANAGFKFKRK